MKPIKSFLSALVLLALLSFFGTILISAESTIYVRTATELSDAVKDLANSGGTVRLAADITLEKPLALPANNARITLDGGGFTVNMNGNLALNGDMDIKNIRFCNVGTYRSIPCGGHDVHFYDTVTCDKSGSYYPSIMAGYTASTDFSGGKVTIDGGTWQRVRGGNAGTGAALQNGSVVFNGGSITEFLQVCGAGQSKSGSRFDVTVNGGSINNIRFFSTSATATADVSLTVSGGSIGGTVRVSVSGGTLNGNCSISLLDGDFTGLTDICGYSGDGSLETVLKLSGELAKAVSKDRVTDTLSTTLLREYTADPCMIYVDGYYYLTMTGSKNIALLRSNVLGEFNDLTLSEHLVYRSELDATAQNVLGYTDLSGTWSPELHYFSEEDFPGQGGWYMYLALRKNTGDSSAVRMVTLRSQSGVAPNGPYVHPTTSEEYTSQPILDRNGKILAEWGCGMSILRIEEGDYKGIYAMWVAEENRGTADFFQKIMIAKLQNPWQLAEEPKAILTPTQYWETVGSGWNGSKYLPAVVEGATALYGEDGQVYLIYCGSGYWSNYGLGQLTWNGGDPTLAASWVKYADNPVFGANDADGNHYSGVYMQGAGHAFFLRDAEDNLFAVYHAYPTDYANGSGKASARNAYIEPCFIDYTKSNGVNKGVLTFTNGKEPAPTSTAVHFTKRFSATGLLDLTDENFQAKNIMLSSTADLTATAVKNGILLHAACGTETMDGYELYRKAAGDADFALLTTLTGKTDYTDTAIRPGTVYTYIAVPYIEHNGTRYSGTASAAASAQFTLAAPRIEMIYAVNKNNAPYVTVTMTHVSAVNGYRIYRYDAAAGAETKVLLETVDSTFYVDRAVKPGRTYVYVITALFGDTESAPVEDSVKVPTFGPYDAAYDINDDGICNIADALLLLHRVLNGGSGTLADVLRIMRFIAG